MRLLFVTGKRAAPYVTEAKLVVEREFGVEADILVLNYPIAALMTTRYIAEQFKKIGANWSIYDAILIPGLCSGDAREIQEVTKTKVYKGTIDAYDLPKAVSLLIRGVELSTVDPADKLLDKNVSEKTLEFREAFVINGMKVPLRSPPFLIFLELDWGKLSVYQLERVKDYIDVPIVGFPAGFQDKEELRKAVRTVSDVFPVFGVDADSPEVLNEAVKLGASVILNLTRSNVDKVKPTSGAAYVIAPEEPGNLEEVRYVINKAKRSNFENIIVDPILSPPPFGLVQSLINYKTLMEEFKEYPFMMGVLNVTELIDADSVGMNALLTAIALELGVSILLTREGNKTRWSSFELRRAVEMATLSRGRKYMKDLGVDLLILKDKRRRVDQLPPDAEEVVKSEPNFDRGYVRVYRGEDEIAVEWIGKERVALKGTNGLYLARELTRRVNPSPEHAAYIGYELAKAEIALVLDKTYIQDAPLFPNAYKGGTAEPKRDKD